MVNETSGWEIEFLPEADKDMDNLDGSVAKQVLSGIWKVSNNPLPKTEGGYGIPLGNKSGVKLNNLLEIKYKRIGIRVVYAIVRDDKVMKILVISARSDFKVYCEALERRKNNDV